MNCWICSTRGCPPRNKNSPVNAGLFRTCAERPRDGRAISAAPFPHIGCHTLPPPPVICETPRHAPPFPSYRCHFAHLRACFPRLSTHPQTAPLMLHYQRFSTLINPPQLSCHGSTPSATAFPTDYPPGYKYGTAASAYAKCGAAARESAASAPLPIPRPGYRYPNCGHRPNP